MGARGPLRSPTSVRGLLELQRERKAARAGSPPTLRTVAVKVPMPPWLPEQTHQTWRRILAGLRAARVPLESIDADAIGFYVVCIDGIGEAGKKSDFKSVARFERDAIVWANQIGASPAARARMGIRPAKPRVYDPWDELAR